MFRRSATTNAVMDVVAFTNLKRPVAFRVNGVRTAELEPDDIASVVFPLVALQKGPNDIRVTCGGLVDAMTLELK